MASKKRGGETPAPKEALARTKKKDEDPIPTRGERAAALMEETNKKLKGRALIQRASDYRLPYLTKRLPTGLLTMDTELKGGWPAGGLTQLIGRKNAGKDMLMWLTIRQLQHFLGSKMKVLLAQTELQADRQQARLLGVQISLGDGDIQAMTDARKENGWPPFTAEEVATMKQEVGTIHELHAISAEDFYDVVLKAVENNIYHLIVINSIGNILAAAEQENESVHDKTYGGSSGPNTTFLKKMTNMLTLPDEWGGVRDTCVLGINQVRDNIKDPNKAYKAPGGNSLEHAKLVDMFIESGPQIGSEVPVYTITPEGPKTMKRFHATGKQVNWKIEKGKAGIHEGGRGSFIYDFRINNVDYYTDTLIAGVQNGVISQEGAWLGIPHPTETGKFIMRAQGKDKFIQALSEDAAAKALAGDENSAMNYIRDAVFRKNDINISYDWADT